MHPQQFGSGPKPGEMSFGLDQIQTIISGPPESDSTSFTALLGLPPPQAVELLISEEFPTNPMPPSIFPSNFALIDRASKFSVYAAADKPPESQLVKQEPSDLDSRPNSSSPAISNQSSKSGKRKERGKKVNESSKRSKRVAAANEASGEKLPYVHVRARRGQATDSHSLAERARREKINARMKLLQELVPGCNKISGTAMVLDEIINHVQALQRHVEFLSMRLAAVDTRVDFNLDTFIAAESGSSIGISYASVFDPFMWGEGEHKQPIHLNGVHQPSCGTSSMITPDDSPLCYDTPPNSASLHSSQLKMEL